MCTAVDIKHARDLDLPFFPNVRYQGIRLANFDAVSIRCLTSVLPPALTRCLLLVVKLIAAVPSGSVAAACARPNACLPPDPNPRRDQPRRRRHQLR